MSTAATTTDYTGISAGIVGKAETDFQSTKANGNSSLGKDDFLKLLVTQLKAQDPLSPMDDKNFVAQLAQFSSLEQLTNISSGMDNLAKVSSQQLVLGAVGFIGKDVRATGDTLTKAGDKVSAMTFKLGEAAAKVSINVFDSNNNIVKTVDLGSKASGEQSFQWDGKNSSGQVVPDGIYKVGISAVNAEGKPLLTTPSVTGTVTGTGNKDGAFVLKLSDGRSVNFMDVQEVVNPPTTASK